MKIRSALALALLGLALSPARVKADAQRDRQACMNDAMTLCGQFIPDRERVATCLIANRSRISRACSAALSRYTPHRPAGRRTAFAR